MSVRMRMDANKKYEHVVDVSKFTEMELEAGHDTANQISQQHGTHSLPKRTEEFAQSALREVGQVRNEAMAQTFGARAQL